MTIKKAKLQEIEHLIQSIENGAFNASEICIKSAYMDDNLVGRLSAALTRNTAVAARITSIIIQAKLVTNFTLPDTLTALTKISLTHSRISSFNISNKLTALENVSLCGNELTSLDIPDSLTALKQIDLGQNNLTDFSAPNTLAALKAIYLYSNQLTSFNVPDTLIALQVIHLYENQITSFNIPDTLTALKHINLARNKLPIFNTPDTLIRLERIDLSRNQLTSFNIHDTLTALKSIKLSSNSLAIVNVPNILTKLVSIYIDNNKLISFNMPNTLTKLEDISLDGNLLTNFNIPNTLRQLRTICLEKNRQLTDITASATMHYSCSIYVAGSPLLSEFTKWKLRQSFYYTDAQFNNQAINIQSIREYYNTFCTTKKLVDHAMTPSLKLQITRDIINSQLISKFCMNNGGCDDIGMRIAEFLVPRLGLEKSLDSCGLHAPRRVHVLPLHIPAIPSSEVRAEFESLNTKAIADATGYEKTKFLYYNFNRIKNSNLGRDISFINTIERLFPSEKSAGCLVMSQSRQKPKRIKL